MKVLGCDLSLTATGLVLLHEHQVISYRLIRSGPGDDPYDLQKRIHEVARAVVFLAKLADRVVLEGHAFGASNSDTRPHELSGVVKYRLWRGGVGFEVHSPTAVKRHATGNGSANKKQMVEAAAQAGFAPVGVPASLVNNLADAFWVADLEETLQAQGGVA